MRRAAIALIASGAALAGCGDSDEQPSAGAGTAESELSITLDPDGNQGPEPPLGANVNCPGDEAAVCDAVEALPEDPGAPTDPQTACTEIYGGPDRLAVEGTLRGEPIDATFTRSNGCEIERFDRFTELLAVLFPDYRPGEALAP